MPSQTATSEQACLESAGVAFATSPGEKGEPDALVPPPDATDEELAAFSAGLRECGADDLDPQTPAAEAFNLAMAERYTQDLTACLRDAGIKVELLDLDQGVKEIRTPGVDQSTEEYRAIADRCGAEAQANEQTARRQPGG